MSSWYSISVIKVSADHSAVKQSTIKNALCTHYTCKGRHRSRYHLSLSLIPLTRDTWKPTMRVYESHYYHTTHFSLPAPKLPSALLFPGNLPAYKLPSLWGITAYSSFSQPFSGFYYNEKRLSCQECFSGFHKFMPAIVYQVDKIILFADCYNNLITALQFIRLNS